MSNQVEFEDEFEGMSDSEILAVADGDITDIVGSDFPDGEVGTRMGLNDLGDIHNTGKPFLFQFGLGRCECCNTIERLPDLSPNEADDETFVCRACEPELFED